MKCENTVVAGAWMSKNIHSCWPECGPYTSAHLWVVRVMTLVLGLSLPCGQDLDPLGRHSDCLFRQKMHNASAAP